MAIHSSVLAWEIPRTEEPGGLQSLGSKRVRLSDQRRKKGRGHRAGDSLLCLTSLFIPLASFLWAQRKTLKRNSPPLL